MSWKAIWDATGLIVSSDTGPAAMDQASFILEGRLVRGGGRPVRMWAGRAAPAEALRLFRMPDGALRVVHREIEFQSPPDFLGAGETLRLHYRATPEGKGSVIDLQNLDREARVIFNPQVPVRMTLDDFLPADARFLAPMSLVAIADHDIPVGPMSCFEEGTPINTPAGPVVVEELRPGMVVDSLHNGPQVVRWTGARELVTVGSMAPVLLRAPYFGLRQDIRVSRQHRILLDGPDVEYMFGEEKVFVRAGDMVNGQSVLLDQTRPVRRFHHFMLDDHDCVSVGRCRMESLLLADMLAAQGRGTSSLAESDALPQFPTLDRAAARSLLSMIAEHRRIAA